MAEFEDGEVVPLKEAKRQARTQNGGAANPGYRPPILDVTEPVTLQGQPIPPRRWIVEDWIPRGCLTMLGGDGGLGKSLLSQMLATSAATAQPWLGLHVARMKTLCVFCEDEDGEIHRRQDAINKHLGIDFADLENMMWVCRVGEDNAIVDYVQTEGFGRGPLDPTELYYSIRKYIGEHGIQILILDSLHDLFPGNENNRPEVRRFTQHLTAIALDMDGAVILTAHPSLSGLTSGSGLSGSTAWNNAVRSRLYLSRPEQDGDEQADDDARVFGRKKANYARANESITMHWQDGVFIRKDEPGGIVGSIDKAAKERRAEEAFLSALDNLNAQGRRVNSHTNQQNYAPKVMKTTAICKEYQRRDLERAMQRLFDQNRISVVEDGPPSHRRSRIEKAEGGEEKQ